MRPNINNEQRRQCARDKQAAPPENWKDDPVNQRGQEIPKGVALLQTSVEQTTGGRWQRFHRERRPQPPFTAHPNAEQGAQQQKRPEIRREGSQQFDDRIKNDIDHQRDAAAKLIAEPSKDECPEWTHHQSESDGERNLRNSPPEIMGDRVKDKGE